MDSLQFRRRSDQKYEVVIDDAVIGLVWRESVRHSGIGRVRLSPYSRYFDAPGELWKCDPGSAAIDADERESVRRHIRREKTTRKSAAQHLLDAYQAADVSLPNVDSTPRFSRADP